MRQAAGLLPGRHGPHAAPLPSCTFVRAPMSDLLHVAAQPPRWARPRHQHPADPADHQACGSTSTRSPIVEPSPWARRTGRFDGSCIAIAQPQRIVTSSSALVGWIATVSSKSRLVAPMRWPPRSPAASRPRRADDVAADDALFARRRTRASFRRALARGQRVVHGHELPT